MIEVGEDIKRGRNRACLNSRLLCVACVWLLTAATAPAALRRLCAHDARGEGGHHHLHEGRRLDNLTVCYL